MAHMAYMACICLYHVTPPDGLTPWDPWMSPWKRPTLGEVRRRGWEGDKVFVIHMTSGIVGICGDRNLRESSHFSNLFHTFPS